VKITLLDTKTGKIAPNIEVSTVDEENSFYFWVEGNFSCDCNRAIYFDLDEDVGCGNGRFIITSPKDFAEADRQRNAQQTSPAVWSTQKYN